MRENAYFRTDDPKERTICGLPINEGWWSRGYEYPWALGYAEAGQIVADMGCGWTPRPFKDALARKGCHVYAVDESPKIMGLEQSPGVVWVVADITRRIEVIPEGSLDAVFCISVLEDVGDKVPLALSEFARCLKPGGLCVLTFDVQYDMEMPLGQYPGVEIKKFWPERYGFYVREMADSNKAMAVVNE